MSVFEWPLIRGAEALPGIFAVAAVVLGITLAVVALGVVGWRRRRAAGARTVRESVMGELQRDPALNGLTLAVSTWSSWTGETTVHLAGVVPSPWYRYAVMRAAARAVARTHRPARIVDQIAIAERRATAPAARRAS